MNAQIFGGGGTAPETAASLGGQGVASPGYLRETLGNRYVYAVVSPRAGGLTLSINMNPGGFCNFDCAYCEVDRSGGTFDVHVDAEVVAQELDRSLALVHSGALRGLPLFGALPDSLLELRHVAFSGDGEPTLCPDFGEVVAAVAHARACGKHPCFKMVLITNAANLRRPEALRGLSLFTRGDEIWAKLDAGSDTHLSRINRADVPIETILDNILQLARRRPVIIQSLFPAVDGLGPSETEIGEYTQRLGELKEKGANIPLVQICSATRPAAKPGIGHLPLQTMSRIAQRVREKTGLRAEVF